MTKTIDKYTRHIFWGKFQDPESDSLSLSCHCLDVAMTFRTLVELDGFRRVLENLAGRRLDAIDYDRLAVLAMLHDLGKANLGFQFKVFDPKNTKPGHILEIEALFKNAELLSRFANALEWNRLSSWFADDAVGESYLLAAWSHHGRPLRFSGQKTGTFHLAAGQWWQSHKRWDPMSAISELVELGLAVFTNVSPTHVGIDLCMSAPKIRL